MFCVFEKRIQRLSIPAYSVQVNVDKHIGQEVYLSPFLTTVTCQINVHNVASSVDFNVFSRLQETLFRLSWSTYFHKIGVI